MGGVLALSAILAISLMFASCANSSDSDDGNPSPSLPENVGENPITETIKLKTSESSSSYLELKADGTAFDISEKEGPKEILSEYKYTYNEEDRTITMKLEKERYHNEFYSEAEGQLLTYDETLVKFNEEYTTEKIRQSEKEYYEKKKDDKWFKDEYPNCNSYADYEAMFVKREGFHSLDDFVSWYRQSLKDAYKAQFGAQITYAYEIEGGKMTLTEKFTGVKNLINKSGCVFNEGSSYGYIDFNWAIIEIDDDYYDGFIDTDKSTITFESEKDGEKVTATYTEDIDRGRVTIKFEGKEYVCEFEGEKYIQE